MLSHLLWKQALLFAHRHPAEPALPWILRCLCTFYNRFPCALPWHQIRSGARQRQQRRGLPASVKHGCFRVPGCLSAGLHEGPFQAVPADIDEENLSVIPADFLGENGQQHKSKQAPEGFIQKAGVHRLRSIQHSAEILIECGIGIAVSDPLLDFASGHAEDAVGVAAECFLVKKVAPSANTLSQQKSNYRAHNGSDSERGEHPL